MKPRRPVKSFFHAATLRPRQQETPSSHSLPFFMEYQKMIAQILSSCRADPCAHHRKQQIGGQIVKYAYQKKIQHGAEQGYRAEPQEAHGHQKGITNRMKMSSPVFIFIDRLNGNLPDFTCSQRAYSAHTQSGPPVWKAARGGGRKENL